MQEAASDPVATAEDVAKTDLRATTDLSCAVI